MVFMLAIRFFFGEQKPFINGDEKREKKVDDAFRDQFGNLMKSGEWEQNIH
jgi:hypothetical protein